MSTSELVGKAAEFDDAEEFLNEIVPGTNDLPLRTRIETALERARNGVRKQLTSHAQLIPPPSTLDVLPPGSYTVTYDEQRGELVVAKGKYKGRVVRG